MKRSLPHYMTDPNCRRWLLWKSIPQPEGKGKKVPFYADGQRRSGTLDSPEDLERLVSFDEAIALLKSKNYTGLGFALGPDGKGGCWQGIDLDDIDKHPELAALKLPGFVELSPSGNGLHAIGYGRQFQNLNANESDVEAYSRGRFFTVTSWSLECLTGYRIPDNVIDLADFVEETLAPLHGQVQITQSAPSKKPIDIKDITPELIVDIESALPYISADDRCTWIAMGHALRELGEVGFKIWAAWSATSDKHQGEEDLKLWDGFKAERTGYAAVFAHAKRNGWVNPKTDPAVIFGKNKLLPDATTSPIPINKFTPIPAGEFASCPNVQWLVKNILPQAELAMIFGPSGIGKSFIVLDLAAAIARGSMWLGRKVQQGKVIYIAAEGAGGLRKRLVAYAKHYEVDLNDIPLEILPLAPDLRVEKDVQDLIQALGKANLIIVDTLACTAPGGDENSSQDMGKVLANCKILHAKTGALVLIVHHAGKDTSKGARGWSGLRAAVDAEIEIYRDKGKPFMRITKLKDAEDGGRYHFNLTPVPLGTDEDGEFLNSCIVKFSDAPMLKLQPKGKWQRLIVTVSQKITHDSKARIPEVIEQVCKMMPEPRTGRDQRKTLATRALNQLVEMGYFKIKDDSIYTQA